MPAMSGYEAFSTIYAGRGGNGSTNRCYLRLNFRRNQPKAERDFTTDILQANWRMSVFFTKISKMGMFKLFKNC